MLNFRKVSSPQSLNQVVEFLTEDVRKHGGSATEVVDVHGHIWEITVCAVPWGTMVLKQKITEFEAWVRLFNVD